MAESTVEIDFFQIEKQKASPKPPSSQRAGSSCRRIQNVVSKINPLLLKTVMAGGATTQARSTHGISSWITGHPSESSSNPSSPSAWNRMLLSPLPVLNPASRSALHGHPGRAPLTIFYNGTVTAFDVTSDKAEAIIRMAESGIVKSPEERPEGVALLDGQHVDGDLMPIARRQPLHRFLEKRKERCTGPPEAFSSPPSPSSMAASQSMLNCGNDD